jgi:hypothetical protein
LLLSRVSTSSTPLVSTTTLDNHRRHSVDAIVSSSSFLAAARIGSLESMRGAHIA